MQGLKNLGYVLAAIVVIGILACGGLILAAVVAIGAALFWGSLAVGFVAFCFKEYFESKHPSQEEA